MILSVDPRTGRVIAEVAEETTPQAVNTHCEVAVRATEALEQLGRSGRAAMLCAMADALEVGRDEIIAVADRETALGEARLSSELTRTCFQLRFLGDVIADGAYLEVTIDHAGESPMGHRPDLRRMLRPLGPVAVFGASNFPLAFSTPGGDTASALAAGCPVVFKAHDAHPATALSCVQYLIQGAQQVGVEVPVVSLVFGTAPALELVCHPHIRAVGFTGSLEGGRHLHDRVKARPDPIPFYGELGSLNSVVVCPAAARERAVEIGRGLATSFTLGVGQFCTKPGLVFLPEGEGGDILKRELAAAVGGSPAGVMLSERIAAGFGSRSAMLRELSGVHLLATGTQDASTGFTATPLVLEAEPSALGGLLAEECFGPVLVAVRYESTDRLNELIERLPPALTATLHASEADRGLAKALLDILSSKAGRVIWNGYPTGVAVSWAMHHGGPYPATTDPLHTSVGAASIRRWLRPVCYQDVPTTLLPPELVDEPAEQHDMPRRVDGHLLLPDARSSGGLAS